MKILSMTATFGKLQNDTLTLKPGLNIIEAPNEWGKSTWCAFLVSMLYGVDTKARTTKDALADKEHYKPWSGSPMSGSMDIDWNGRRITIQRRTKGRIPMGDFYAFETDTGLEVKELTAENCGQQLLGVERSVFTRSGFLRFSDLPVEQDEALRSRLNALVTTGDESGTAQMLGQKLKELKNKCRFNRSGLLPQAEAQRDELERRIGQQDALLHQVSQLQTRQKQLEQWQADLQNHKVALAYAGAKDNAQRLHQAEIAAEQSRLALAALEEQCAVLPDQEAAERAIQEASTLAREASSMQMEAQMLPPAPAVPQAPAMFAGQTPEEALSQAKADREGINSVPVTKASPLLLILGLILAAVGGALCVWTLPVGIITLCIGGILAVAGGVIFARQKSKAAVHKQKLDALTLRYGTGDADKWVSLAQGYADAWTSYRQDLAEYNALRGDLDARRQALNEKMEALGGDVALIAERNRQIIRTWETLDNTRRQDQQAQSHLKTLRSMVKEVTPPAQPDNLSYTEAETDRMLSDAAFELRQVTQKLGQYQGQVEAVGNRAQAEQALAQLRSRIRKLEQTYAALNYAQEALAGATAQLQRRFAPRITKQAQELFADLTAGRYQRLTLGEDLSMQASAQGEDTLRSAQWRSDGTVDQLYLALRLAVAKELTPNAPLVLDDALVRFDDARLKAALSILDREAKNKQVLLFTCQNREKSLLS